MLLEFDRLKVVQAERMTYTGLLPKSVGFNVEQNLQKLKNRRMEEEAREQMERDLESEMLQDQGISRSEIIHKNLDKYVAELDSQKPWGDIMTTILQKIEEQKKKAMSHHKERFNVIEKQFEKLLQKYPGSVSRLKNKKFISQIQEAENESDEDDEEEENEEDVENQFAEHSKQFDDEIKNQVSQERKKAAQQPESLVTEEKLRMARGDIVQ